MSLNYDIKQYKIYEIYNEENYDMIIMIWYNYYVYYYFHFHFNNEYVSNLKKQLQLIYNKNDIIYNKLYNNKNKLLKKINEYKIIKRIINKLKI